MSRSWEQWKLESVEQGMRLGILDSLGGRGQGFSVVEAGKTTSIVGRHIRSLRGMHRYSE